MFRCDITGKNSKSKEKPIRLIVERRERKYQLSENEGDVSFGWEIGKELVVSLDGLKQYVAKFPDNLEAQARLASALKAEALSERLAAGLVGYKN